MKQETKLETEQLEKRRSILCDECDSLEQDLRQTLLLEDLILSEKSAAFSNINSRLILLSVQYDKYLRGEVTREDVRECHEELLKKIWDSMFLEQKIREKYKEHK